ncbi:hypothetical protein ACVINY_000028 [Sinorhizobium meliloti]
MTKINDLTGREQAFSAAARRFPQAEPPSDENERGFLRLVR